MGSICNRGKWQTFTNGFEEPLHGSSWGPWEQQQQGNVFLLSCHSQLWICADPFTSKHVPLFGSCSISSLSISSALRPCLHHSFPPLQLA